jgi:uncharacterized membrane protein
LQTFIFRAELVRRVSLPRVGFYGKNRLEAFSDGVIAIIITIMVLEMKVPHGDDLSALDPLFRYLSATCSALSTFAFTETTITICSMPYKK